MHRRKPTRIPKYRRQKRRTAHDLAFVELDGIRHYLGQHGSSQSKTAYARLITDWTANGCMLPVLAAEITIDELILRYYQHAETYYVRPDGQPTSEVRNIRLALRQLRRLYGDTAVADFGPRNLKSVRQAMVDQCCSRTYINHQVGRIKRMFRWGVAEELVKPAVFQGLCAVEGLKKGRSDAHERPAVVPAPERLIAAIEPFVSRQVWAMVQTQLLTAARPGEILCMRPVDLDTSGRIWLYRPQDHKNSYRSQARTIYVGPLAQDILRPFLTGRPVNAFMFSPAEAEQERRAAEHDARVTPASCGNRPGHNLAKHPRTKPGHCYDVNSYRRAITRACDLAFPPPADVSSNPERLKQWRRDHRWTPYQLRHNAATRLRKEFGIEAAQLLLGHARCDVTQIYAEINEEKALELAARIG